MSPVERTLRFSFQRVQNAGAMHQVPQLSAG